MYQLIIADAQRWIKMGQIVSADLVTPRVLLRLLFLHLPFRAVVLFRIGSWCKRKGLPGLPGFFQRLIMSRYGLEIMIGMPVGGGLYIPHPFGTVVAAQRIGANCSIIASVTIGMRNEHRFPVIGDNVFIGAGARVLGGVTVGDGAVIGANAVVIHDVPRGATAVGIPARVAHSKQIPAELAHSAQ